MKTKILITLISLMAIALVVLGSVLGVVCHKVKEFDRKHGANVFANLSPSEYHASTNSIAKSAKKQKVDSVSGTEVATAENDDPPEMKIERVVYEGENVIEVYLSERPDMDVVRNYIKVEPLAEGRLSFKYAAAAVPIIKIIGEFAYRTNVTLKILKGLPLYGKGANPAPEGSLKEDFVYTFRRDDRKPYVKFADNGRYLPPSGRRAIAIEAMNVTNVVVEIRRVEPANVVQMLAREERVYAKHMYWWGRGSGADAEETEELAGEVETNLLHCANRPNEKELLPFAVLMDDGKSKNGIYLVRALINDYPRQDWWCSWADVGSYNPARYRVVCVSDLALSVRRWDGDKLGVWVTSLMTGQPVSNTKITVYSSARIKVMEGVTDENGWCEPKRTDKGEPFAVVAAAADNADMTFMALKASMLVDETYRDGKREKYLSKNESTAFLWTERGIYRHDEKIFVHAIFRDGMRNAPKPFPIELCLLSPLDSVRAKWNSLTDERGTIAYEGFSVGADLPSGVWKIEARIPGSNKVLGRTQVKIEEFAPPQIRVKVTDDEALNLPSFGFSVSAEHLFGGAAHNLACEGAVVFEDEPFAPAKWKGWRFGNDMLGLKPSFRRLLKGERLRLDKFGTAVFSAPLWADSGLPKAAVRVTAQGTVFEDGGRPATARKSVIRHFYPYYIGSTIPGWIKRPVDGRLAIDIACVAPDGKRIEEPKKLSVKLERIDMFYSYKKDERDWASWNCERVRSAISEGIVFTTSTNSNTRIEVPISECGDYAVTIEDKETRVSFGREFYVSDCGDNVVRAPLANPTEVIVAPDKAFYRLGERPRLSVRSPFAGKVLIMAMREKCVYTEVFTLTNATSELVLRPVAAGDAPNIDVYLSVVQGSNASAKRLAVRAHGQTTIAVRPIENEIAVDLKGSARIGEKGSSVSLELSAPGASEAVFTLVDESINILTGQETPDPVGFFAKPRMAEHHLFDIYHRVLPVLGQEDLKKSGVKTGGGFGAEMLSRVSPVPTRRFKPLAMWKTKVPVVDGKAKAEFDLAEFVGEVRVTAVAYNSKSVGAKSAQLKVSPKLVMMPDAPRFVAPHDKFGVTLPIYNRSGVDGKIAFSISVNGTVVCENKELHLKKDSSTNILCSVSAPAEPGEMKIGYSACGFGEKHDVEIALPVRPAVAWRETAGVARLKSGEKFVSSEGRVFSREFDSPLGGYTRALEWLADYPHGCLEQTVSRVFPLIAAGGILSGVDFSHISNRAEVVKAGVKRVESMVRQHDFVMWPDADYAPWDKEVSLYAVHFLIEAEMAGEKVSRAAKSKIFEFLAKWAMSTNENISAYAVHSLALAGRPEKDRMLRLYDSRATLSLLSKARLARAFAAIGDRARAESLLTNAASPSSVKEAAFALCALLEVGADDGRAAVLLKYLNDARDRERLSWGTTGENAHALMAIGEYYRRNPPVKGEKYVIWRKLELPRLEDVRSETNGISITRRLLTPEGESVDLKNLTCGEMLVSEITIESQEERFLSDLVIEDLFAGAFEPVSGMLSQTLACDKNEVGNWVMRSDARDDRMLVFSKRFAIAPWKKAIFRYPLRVVSSGQFTLPGVSVEAMYFPSLNAKTAPEKVVSRALNMGD